MSSTIDFPLPAIIECRLYIMGVPGDQRDGLAIVMVCSISDFPGEGIAIADSALAISFPRGSIITDRRTPSLCEGPPFSTIVLIFMVALAESACGVVM